MAFPTKDGKKKSSKFRAARYDREHESDSPEPKREGSSEQEEAEPTKGGPRAQMHAMEGHGQGNPEHTTGMEEEQAEEAVHPGIHEEIKGVVAEHGPAHTIHMNHDHERQQSHVHSVHADGHEHHSDHVGEMHHMNAHHHAMHAAGIPQEHIHGDDEESAGKYPAGNEPPGEESYGEPL